jgi:hypothetical protein
MDPYMQSAQGISSDPNVAAPKMGNQVPRPQSAMGSAVDASVGRAAFTSFFPGGALK